MSKKINIFLIVVAVAVAIVAGVYKYNNMMNERQAPEQEDQNQAMKMPPFASGEITKIEGDTVYLKGAFEASPEQELSGKVNSETLITKQVIRDGLPTLAHIQLSEVKVNDKVVVFYGERQENSIVITRLQVLD